MSDERKRLRYFLDWEFHEDGKVIVPISLGVVCEDGRELYCVSSDFDPDAVNDWVRANVLPQLPPRTDPAWMPRTAIRDALVAFVGESEPEFWAYYADYDWVCTAQLFGRMLDMPAHFPKLCLDLKQWQIQQGCPALPVQAKGEHDALEDARWNRDVYEHLAARAPENTEVLVAIAGHLGVKPETPPAELAAMVGRAMASRSAAIQVEESMLADTRSTERVAQEKFIRAVRDRSDARQSATRLHRRAQAAEGKVARLCRARDRDRETLNQIVEWHEQAKAGVVPYCAYCQSVVLVDELPAHMARCEKHPMRALVATVELFIHTSDLPFDHIAMVKGREALARVTKPLPAPRKRRPLARWVARARLGLRLWWLSVAR